MKKLRIFLVVFCLAGGSSLWGQSAFAASGDTPWLWDILVVPPDKGWESDAGLSIQRTLLWHAAEVAEKDNGILGHDLNFVFLPPTNEESVQRYVLSPTKRTIAVLSFASYPVDRYLAERFSKSAVPLLLAEGENVFLAKQGKLFPSVFALDLFRDYRCRAFTDYASKTLKTRTRLGVLGARFTLNEEREAVICFDLFSDAGFMPMPYWIEASAPNSFTMLEQEIKDSSDGVLISCVGGMASKEIWHGIMRHQIRYRLWYVGAPDKSFLSFNGMLFADQNMYLDERGGFDPLKRTLWTTHTLAIPDKVAAGRANALALWLLKALEPLRVEPVRGDLTEGVLAARLAEVKGIPFGRQVLDIDKETHRPAQRQVYMLEVGNRTLLVRDVLEVEGMKRYDY